MLSIAIVAALWGPRAEAQVPAIAEPDTSFLAGEVPGQTLSLTLDQAQRLGVANSPLTRGALGSLRAARGSRMTAAGDFDPVLVAADEQISIDSPVSSPFAGSETRQRLVTGGLSWLSPIGTLISASVVQDKFESNAPFTTLPRERRAGARLAFVQPLLKGFGTAATRGELRARDREVEAAERRYDSAELQVSADVEASYWTLYAIERDLEARLRQRQSAAVFLRDQMLRGRAGVAGPAAVAAARTFLADQEAILLEVRLGVRTASDRLAQAIGISPGSQARLHAADEPIPPPALDPLDEMMRRAMVSNTELRAAEQDTAAALHRLKRAAWNAWPSVEAFGGYGGQGLAGTSRPIVFGGDTLGTSSDTGFDHAWDQVWGDDYPEWNFGLRLTMPIPWRADRGEHERSRGEYERARAVLHARRLALETDVRTAYRDAETAQATLRALRELLSATQEQARIGRLEYEAGRATAYDIVDLEAQVAGAQLRMSQAMVRVARSRTELRRLTQPAPQRTP
ncbi:MAG TPA: TolC family protein [Candidatus Eisenbacteria bacterium]|nr:TolC family protein [Candidatus Eisenbacteria bacterium]